MPTAVTIVLLLLTICGVGFGAWLLLCAAVLTAIPHLTRLTGDPLPPVPLSPLLVAGVGIVGGMLFISGAVGFARLAVLA